MEPPIQLLLIEDDPEHAELIRTHICRRRSGAAQITWARSLKEGLDGLTKARLMLCCSTLGCQTAPSRPPWILFYPKLRCKGYPLLFYRRSTTRTSRSRPSIVARRIFFPRIRSTATYSY